MFFEGTLYKKIFKKFKLKLMDHFGDTPLWQMAIIRSELLTFLLGARVKVSLMLREHKQMEGVFI